ncbi:MAG: hypothetical protein AAF725_13535, partial [Acidobacteriota bacterium]
GGGGDLCLGGADPFSGGPCCGDGVCETGELCALDCSVSFCGDGVCDLQESCSSCSSDCGSCSVCGDGVCSGSESCATCSFDCTSCFAFPFQAFYRGNDFRTLRTATSFSGTSWSGDNVLGNGAMSRRSPAAVKFNNRIFVFYRGATNEEIYVTWSDDGVSWAGNRVLGNGVETKEGVAATVFNNRIYVFNKGRYTNAIWMSSSSNGFTWSTPRVIVSDGNGTDGPPAAVTYNGKIEVHYRHDQNKIKHVTSSDAVTWSFGPDRSQRASEGVALAVFNDRLYLAFGTPRGVPNFSNTSTITVYNRLAVYSKLNDGPWSGVSWVLEAESDRRPALAASENRLVLLYKGVSSKNLFYSYSNDGQNWLGEGLAIGRTDHGGPALLYTD